MSWPPKSLSEILEQSGHRRAGEQQFPVLSITMKQGLVDQADKFKKRVASSDTSNYRVAYRNELVVGFPIDEGVIGFQTKYPAGIVSPAYDIWKLKHEEECHIPYLERFLRSPQARRLYAQRMQGAVARRRSLTKADFLKLEIPFPPLDDQIRIAHLLGKVEGLIAQRKQHLQQLDDLLKSVFLEMFGDPVRNEKGWEPGASSVYADMVTVGVVVKPASYYVESGVIALRSLNIKPNRIELNDVVYFSQDANDGILSKSRLKTDDVVIVRTGKTGTAAVVTSHLEGANCIDLIIVRPKREIINPQYLTCLLNSERGMALVASREVGGIQKHFNVGALNRIPFPLPPIDQQNQFAAMVEKVEGIKSRYQKSLIDLENLYGALSQKAFKGELDLSRVPLPAITGGVNAIEEAADTFTAAGTVTEAQQVIDLPDVENMADALTTAAGRERVLNHWLDAYLAQLKGSAFSVNDFLTAAQVRMSEVCPDSDFEIGLTEYDQLKDWVFEALKTGRLLQTFDDKNKNMKLERTPPQWGSW